MVLLGGLEFVAGAAAVGALRKTEFGSRILESVTSTARSVLYDDPDVDHAENEAANLNEATSSPARVKLRIRSMRVPELRGPRDYPPEERVLRGLLLLEQVSNAVPRRYGDVGGAWYMVFSTALQGRSLAHMLRCSAPAGPCLILIKDSEGRIFGAYCSELREAPSQGQAHFFGTGETFLLAVGELRLPPMPASAPSNSPKPRRPSALQRGSSADSPPCAHGGAHLLATYPPPWVVAKEAEGDGTGGGGAAAGSGSRCGGGGAKTPTSRPPRPSPLQPPPPQQQQPQQQQQQQPPPPPPQPQQQQPCAGCEVQSPCLIGAPLDSPQGSMPPLAAGAAMLAPAAATGEAATAAAVARRISSSSPSLSPTRGGRGGDGGDGGDGVGRCETPPRRRRWTRDLDAGELTLDRSLSRDGSGPILVDDQLSPRSYFPNDDDDDDGRFAADHSHRYSDDGGGGDDGDAVQCCSPLCKRIVSTGAAVMGAPSRGSGGGGGCACAYGGGGGGGGGGGPDGSGVYSALGTPAASPRSARRLGARNKTVIYAFRWERKANDYFVRTDATSLVVGAGGHFGLSLNDSLTGGTSGSSATFGNLPLPSCAGATGATGATGVGAGAAAGAGVGAAVAPASPMPGRGSGGGPTPVAVSRSATPPQPPGVASGDPDDVEYFTCAALEVWAVDEPRARQLCADYEAFPNDG